MNWKPRGTFQTQPVNPAVEWATILDWDPKFPVEAILSVCSQALGILDMQAQAAEEREGRPFNRLRSWLPRVVGAWFRHARPVVRWAGGIAATVVAAALIYMLGLS